MAHKSAREKSGGGGGGGGGDLVCQDLVLDFLVSHKIINNLVLSSRWLTDSVMTLALRLHKTVGKRQRKWQAKASSTCTGADCGRSGGGKRVGAQITQKIKASTGRLGRLLSLRCHWRWQAGFGRGSHRGGRWGHLRAVLTRVARLQVKHQRLWSSSQKFGLLTKKTHSITIIHTHARTCAHAYTHTLYQYPRTL